MIEAAACVILPFYLQTVIMDQEFLNNNQGGFIFETNSSQSLSTSS